MCSLHFFGWLVTCTSTGHQGAVQVFWPYQEGALKLVIFSCRSRSVGVWVVVSSVAGI